MSKHTKDLKAKRKPEISLSSQPTIAKKPTPRPSSYKKLLEELAKTKGISPVKLVEEIKDNQKVLQPAAPNSAYEASTATVEPGSQKTNDVILSSQGGGELGRVDYGLTSTESLAQPDLAKRTSELETNDLDIKVKGQPINGSAPTPFSTIPRPQGS